MECNFGIWMFVQVQLIGYCTTNSLFLVYEYIENGTLDHHLRRRKSDGKQGVQVWPVFVFEANV